MQIQLDENGYIRAFAESGLADPIIYDGQMPDDFIENAGFYRLETSGLVFDSEKKAAADIREGLQNELSELYEWFIWYDAQVMQYHRAARMGEDFDRDINELDTQAEINRLRIGEIKMILGGD